MQRCSHVYRLHNPPGRDNILREKNYSQMNFEDGTFYCKETVPDLAEEWW